MFILFQVERWVFLVCFLVEAVEGGASFRVDFIDEFCFLDEVDILHAFAAVALITLFAYYCLEYVLKLCQRKEVWEEFWIRLMLSAPDRPAGCPVGSAARRRGVEGPFMTTEPTATDKTRRSEQAKAFFWIRR